MPQQEYVTKLRGGVSEPVQCVQQKSRNSELAANGYPTRVIKALSELVGCPVPREVRCSESSRPGMLL